MHVIGIDAGGSKTVCQVGEPDGRIIRETRGPGANLQSAGELEVEKVLHDVMTEALAGLDAPPAAICVGMAGVDRPNDARVMRAMLTRLCRGSRTLVVNDALHGPEAGPPGPPGHPRPARPGEGCVRRRPAGAGGGRSASVREGVRLGRAAISAGMRRAPAAGATHSAMKDRDSG